MEPAGARGPHHTSTTIHKNAFFAFLHDRIHAVSLLLPLRMPSFPEPRIIAHSYCVPTLISITPRPLPHHIAFPNSQSQSPLRLALAVAVALTLAVALALAVALTLAVALALAV